MTTPQSDSKTLITQAYTAFNQRDIPAAFALMTDQVSWPKASEGGRVTGKPAIRDYWTRQWSEFDPHVDPAEITVRPDGKAEVRVHQVVKTLTGELLFDGEIAHVFTLADGLIDRMDLGGEAGADSTPSAAFAHH